MATSRAPRRIDLAGTRQYRIIPSRLPPIALFETLVAPDELEILYAIESMTNDRIQAGAGNLHLLPREDWLTGPGATVVMAAFTHIGHTSRFSDGSYGTYYCGLDEDTAIAETVFHTARRMRETAEPPIELDMRCYQGTVRESLEDIRGPAYSRYRDPDVSSWPACQAFGANRRDAGAWGLYYRSVRHDGGECIAAFRTRAISIPRQGKHFRYCWNGKEIEQVLTISRVRSFADVHNRP